MLLPRATLRRAHPGREQRARDPARCPRCGPAFAAGRAPYRQPRPPQPWPLRLLTKILCNTLDRAAAARPRWLCFLTGAFAAPRLYAGALICPLWPQAAPHQRHPSHCIWNPVAFANARLVWPLAPCEGSGRVTSATYGGGGAGSRLEDPPTPPGGHPSVRECSGRRRRCHAGVWWVAWRERCVLASVAVIAAVATWGVPHATASDMQPPVSRCNLEAAQLNQRVHCARQRDGPTQRRTGARGTARRPRRACHSGSPMCRHTLHQCPQNNSCVSVISCVPVPSCLGPWSESFQTLP
jgi:hypothetical protein